MATVGDPRVVLADEPTAELDPTTSIEVIGLLRASAAGGAAVVVNTHDHAVADAADRVLALHHGTLHSERREGTATVAVIDSVGRVQLPAEFLNAFPELRAEIRYEDGRVILTQTGARRWWLRRCGPGPSGSCDSTASAGARAPTPAK